MGRVWKQDLRPVRGKIGDGTSNITIERAYRVGEKSNDKERAIVVQFSFYKDKINTKISIFEDFSKETMQIHKEKWKEVLANKKQGKILYLQYRSVIYMEGRTPA